MHEVELSSGRIRYTDTGGGGPVVVLAGNDTNCDAYRNFLPPVFRYRQLLGHLPGGVRLLARLTRSTAVRSAGPGTRLTPARRRHRRCT